jgi:thiol-disulfide isomerase/thioredoxin
MFQGLDKQTGGSIMKGYLITAAWLLVAVSATAGEIRTWTSTAGTTIDAEFVKEKYGTAYLKTADGSVKQIRSADLSKADQDLIARLADPFAAKKAAAGAAVPPKASDAMYELFGDELRDARGKTVSVDALAGKTVGIYFSAHWCPPCKAFTPILVDFHKKMTQQGKPFEIVFVSSDRDKGAMDGYMKEMDMPWLALPFGDDHKPALSKKYKVSGIPKLVIIDAEGKLVTENGRGDVTKSGAKAFADWQ